MLEDEEVVVVKGVEEEEEKNIGPGIMRKTTSHCQGTRESTAKEHEN